MEYDKENQKIVDAVEGNAGLTSVQAAALYLSEGRTMDPQEASIMSEAPALDVEKLQQAGLRRMMGFNFVVKVAGSRVLVISKEGPHVIKRAKIKPGETDDYGNIISEALIKRLTDACIRLKISWDAEVMRREDNAKRAKR